MKQEIMSTIDFEKTITGIAQIHEAFAHQVLRDYETMKSMRLMENAVKLLVQQKKTIDCLNKTINEFNKNAVPVVRCKNCRYRGTWQCWQYFLGHKTDDDWFCADGKS